MKSTKVWPTNDSPQDDLNALWACFHPYDQEKTLKKWNELLANREAVIRDKVLSQINRDREMSEHIHQSNLIEGYDSEEADKQSLAAWEWLVKQPELNNGVICELQKRIVKHQHDLKPEWRGRYREIDVWVGGHKGLTPVAIHAAMDKWLEGVGTPKEMHIEFELIHPFVDGNGRTGRMLMWYQEVKQGTKPTLIPNKTKHQDYYPWFKERS